MTAAVSMGTTVTASALAATASGNNHAETGRDPSTLADTQTGVPIEVAQVVIQRLFTVGLALASCASIIDGPAAVSLLEQTTDGLDGIIRDLRTAIFDRSGPARPQPSW